MLTSCCRKNFTSSALLLITAKCSGENPYSTCSLMLAPPSISKEAILGATFLALLREVTCKQSISKITVIKNLYRLHNNCLADDIHKISPKDREAGNRE